MIGFERFARHEEISQVSGGSLLLSELSCTACHRTEDSGLQPKRGPSLVGAGIRLRADWLRRYLSDPHGVKPGSTMPDILSSVAEPERDEVIGALVAFLQSQQAPFPVLKAGGASPVVFKFWERGDPERGARLYHSVGCVACHAADPDYETVESKPSAIDELIEQLDPEEIADLGLSSEARRVDSVPHGDLAAKYSLRSLTMMLLDPEKMRPSARMPSLRLTPSEAADIAAHLLGSADSELPSVAPTQSLVERGKELFVQFNCAACHDAKGVASSAESKPLASLSPTAENSCINRPAEAMSRYALDREQQQAIRAALTALQEENEWDASDAVSHRMLQLNCYGCHRRNELGGVGRFRKAYFETVGHVDLGDEGRLPPTLTGVGRKLVPKALAGVFHPKTPPHRPFMTARMPTYANESVETVIQLLPRADGVERQSEVDVFVESDSLRDAGRDLVNTGCVGCHAFRGESLPGVVGIDLSGITDRVYPKWFYQFVLNPTSVKERTRMPTFFPDGKSNRKDLLDGDVHRQLSAAWGYLKHLENESLPDKIEEARSANYELLPQDDPIVLRTFMEQAGTHAIAVGFPAGVHYAFDAEHVFPAVAWSGRFLDARGTWFERFTPPADPLGERMIRLSSGAIVQTEGGTAARFRGYRLGSDGVPVMLYRCDDVTVEDRIEPNDSGGLRRTLSVHVESAATTVSLLLHAGKQLTSVGPAAYRDEQGLVVTLQEPAERSSEISGRAGDQRWLIPLKVNDSATVVLEYRW